MSAEEPWRHVDGVSAANRGWGPRHVDGVSAANMGWGPPAQPPPSEPGGHAQLESLRSCLAAALRSRRLRLLQDYEKFKQRNQLLIQAQRAELARLELDAAASAHATEQAQLLVQWHALSPESF